MRRSQRPSGAPTLGSAVARTVVLCLVGSLLLVAAREVQPAADPAAGSTVPLRLAASSSCTDTLILGIDGNGQGRGARYGAVVGKVANRIKRKAEKQNRSVDLARVRVKTPGAKVMAGGRMGAPAARAITRKRLNRWQKPVGKAVRKANRTLAKRMASCPEQQVVVVGYAQGAAAAHKVLQRLAKKDQLANVAGAVLVSDPWRTKRSSAGRPLGAPAVGNGSQGALARFKRSVGDVPGGTDTFRVVPVCTRGDLVCHPTRAKVRRAVRTSLAYGKPSHRKAMNRAADRVLERLMLFPVPAQQQLMVAAEQPLDVQLTVSGGSPTTPPATWSPVSLPKGFSLTSEGRLTGELDAPGLYEVVFTVAGTNPVTPSRTGRLLLNSRAESGALSAGGASACEVRADGTAWCWGRNDFGQLGDGTRTLATEPVQVVGAGWARVSTSGSSTCGIKVDGTLWCWGLNNFGQLGGADKANSAVPRRVGTGTTWQEVSTAWHHACATQADGTMWCWGQNVRGQLGNAKTGTRSTAPVKVVGNRTWTAPAVGGWHSCGTTADGNAWCWGENTFGQVGDGTNTLRVRPQLVKGGGGYAQLSAAWGRTCGVRTDGSARCWGENSDGALGDGSRKDRNVPVDVVGGDWGQVSTGTFSTCASKRSGEVACWGDNRYGQMGPSAGRSSTVPVAAGIASVGGIVSGGWMHACGIADRGPRCWGANDAAQLGTGTTVPPSAPRADWPVPTALPTKKVKKWGAKKIARTELAGRPKVSGRAAARRQASFGVMTFNVLGSQHTAPSGGRPAFAPGRIRAEWGKQLIAARNASLVGAQEVQPDQVVAFHVATEGAYTVYPGNSMGYAGATQSVMWRESEWQYVWGTTISMPFMRKSRPQPVVRLRHRATGAEVYLLNIHFSPGKMTQDRKKGLNITVQAIKELEDDGLPILLTGDFNMHKQAFCKITGKTSLQAAQGGSNDGTCKPPKHMRVDWLFGSRGSFSGTAIDISPRVRRATDHAVISSRFSVQ